MTLASFKALHNLRLSTNVDLLCHLGLDYMTKSSDPLHNVDHIYRMLDDLDLMIRHVREINWRRVNFEILLLAVIWHDTYKSRHLAKTKRRMFFDHVLADGLGSMRLFKRHAKKAVLDKKTISKVSYAIRKHSVFQFLPRLTIEAKIVKYLDELEDWSYPRFDFALDSIHSLSEAVPRLLPIVRFYFEHWMLRKNGGRKFPVWIKVEYTRRKQLFIRDMKDKVLASLRPATRPLHPS